MRTALEQDPLRIRGTPRATGRGAHDARIIPAGAGSTTPCGPTPPRMPDHPTNAGSTLCVVCCFWCSGDHPRGCGEHRVLVYCWLIPPGSSPRMRGAPRRARLGVGRRRIIPADAGSTIRRQAGYSTTRDHPRGCGEHHKLIQITARVHGSSPRMRGALPLGPWHCGPEGIIPADAGSTVSAGPNTASRKDHPRGCGEHFGNRYDRDIVKGSSPRMRGAQVAVKILVHDGGIIPADAGSTISHYCCITAVRDHPRGCREHPQPGPRPKPGPESSPRMQGAPLASAGCSCLTRIIPADAGSTHPENLVAYHPGDHPRGCREHMILVPL